jgi:hypothetical protein
MGEISISGGELVDYPYIRGVLAYLDQTTTSHERVTARETDQGVGIPKSKLRDSVAERLRSAFKLRHTIDAPSPIGKELRHFRLYYPPDASDALAAAWCARQRGGSALAALQADYDVDCAGRGILSRENWSDLPPIHKMELDRMRDYAEEGDQLFSYRYYCGFGYRLLRGLRLVHVHEVAHYFESMKNFRVEYEAYNSAGGSLAVIEGRLIWPPP